MILITELNLKANIKREQQLQLTRVVTYSSLRVSCN